MPLQKLNSNQAIYINWTGSLLRLGVLYMQWHFDSKLKLLELECLSSRKFTNHICVGKWPSKSSNVFRGKARANKMKIICAGFPKTGTKSMAMALRWEENIFLWISALTGQEWRIWDNFFFFFTLWWMAQQWNKFDVMHKDLWCEELGVCCDKVYSAQNFELKFTAQGTL